MDLIDKACCPNEFSSPGAHYRLLSSLNPFEKKVVQYKGTAVKIIYYTQTGPTKAQNR